MANQSTLEIKEKAIEYLMEVTEGNFTLWKHSVDVEKAIDIALKEQQQKLKDLEKEAYMTLKDLEKMRKFIEKNRSLNQQLTELKKENKEREKK